MTVSPVPWTVETCRGCGAAVIEDAEGNEVVDVHWIYDTAAGRVVNEDDAELIVRLVNQHFGERRG